jgi:hypothetical protein
MLQHLIVAMIVLGATLYSGWALLPAGTRRSAAARLAARAAGWGLGAARARRLEQSLAASGSCSSGCDSCKGCGPAPSSGEPRPVSVVAMPRSRR